MKTWSFQIILQDFSALFNNCYGEIEISKSKFRNNHSKIKFIPITNDFEVVSVNETSRDIFNKGDFKLNGCDFDKMLIFNYERSTFIIENK